MSLLQSGESIRGGTELLQFLLDRNMPDGVIPEPLLRMIVVSLSEGRVQIQSGHEWKDDRGNIISQQVVLSTIRDVVVYRVLDMARLVNGSINKARWPLALAFCIICDIEDHTPSTSEKRMWWLWETNGGNQVLITHDHEDGGRFRYWINPDD